MTGAAGSGPLSPGQTQRLLDAVALPLIVIDRDQTIRAANRDCEDVFGPRLVGRTLSLAIRHPDALEAVARALATAERTEQTFTIAGAKPRSFLLGIGPFGDPRPPGGDPRPPGGDPRPPGDDPGGGVAGAILSFYDVTAIQQTDRMRADFVANVSHELKTPLASLIGFIETLRGPASDDAEARERFLAIMANEAGRMARLIDDLLSLSRIERDEHIRPEKTADLASILEEVITSLSIPARERGMKIDNRLDNRLDGQALKVIGDPDQLIQVFQNILGNALKYGRPDTPVTISTAPVARLSETGGPGHCITIADHGDGIARQHMPRLTERFYRADAARSRALGGTGLGLAIVKHIVSRHQGALTIDSDQGVGTSVTVCLPQAARQES